MGYTGHNIARPRSILVIIGGIIAWTGLVGGVLLGTPQYHLAMTVKEEPVELTWQELVENGLTDNSHVKLLNVAIAQPQTAGFLDEMLEFDPDLSVEEQQKAFEDMAANMDFEQFASDVIQPLKVYPKGEDPSAFPAKVVVPSACWATDQAVAEIESSGTLTGRFTLGDGTDLSTRMAKSIMAAATAAEPDQDRGANGEPVEAEQPEQELKYVYEPVMGVASLSESRQWFWLCGMAVAFGLVICGAGGPSIFCCVFFQVPSILSCFGYPMRYGRASNSTRVLYLLAGLGLVGYGYQTMMVEGGFGQLDGDLLKTSLGFVPTFVGLAAILGAGTNWLADRLNLSLESSSTSKKSEPQINYTQACSLDPVDCDLASDFTDRYLVESSELLPDELEQISQSLVSVGFEYPENVTCQDGLEVVPVLIQLGCQDMVVADVELVDGQPQVRLASVLQDGISVITLSDNTPAEKSSRFGTSGLYQRSRSSDPVEMLSEHLEQTIGMAEKRDTTVLTFDPSETVDVATFTRRVLAAIQSQYGEISVEVGSAKYGRFHFPPQAIPVHADV